jgi:hypothetical protein
MEGEAARNGAVDVHARLKEDAKECHQRAHPNECLTMVLEDGQREEGIGVKMRQHHTLCGQHGVKEEQHSRDHPRHQEAEEDPCIPRLMTDGLTSMGEGGWTSLI